MHKRARRDENPLLNCQVEIQVEIIDDDDAPRASFFDGYPSSGMVAMVALTQKKFTIRDANTISRTPSFHIFYELEDFAMPSPELTPQRPILIEQTSKKYKLIRGVGILILLATAGFALVNSDEFGTAEGITTTISIIGFIAGLIVLGVGLLLSWWHHG